MAEGSGNDMLIEALDDERQRFVAACLSDDLPTAVDACRASLALMEEHKANMRLDLDMLRKRIRLRKEGR